MPSGGVARAVAHVVGDAALELELWQQRQRIPLNVWSACVRVELEARPWAPSLRLQLLPPLLVPRLILRHLLRLAMILCRESTGYAL